MRKSMVALVAGFIVLLATAAIAGPFDTPIRRGPVASNPGTVTEVTGSGGITVVNGTTAPALSITDNGIVASKLKADSGAAAANTVFHGDNTWRVPTITILDNLSEPTAAQVYSSINIVSAAITVTLPTAVAPTPGKVMSICIMDSGTAHDIILDVQGGDTLTFDGTEQTAGVGITNASGSSTGDLVCLIATAANKWSTAGSQGTWASQ